VTAAIIARSRALIRWPGRERLSSARRAPAKRSPHGEERLLYSAKSFVYDVLVVIDVHVRHEVIFRPFMQISPTRLLKPEGL
jgi:hypothetical protein